MKSSIKALLLGSVGSLAIAGAVLAADLSPALPPLAPVWSWTGFYAGLNGGFGWGADPVVFSSGPIGVNSTPSGGVVGLQVGYNWQFTPEWVVGVEADIDSTDIFGSQRVSAFGLVGTTDPFAVVAQQRLSALGTLRGRIGYALDNVLLYGTGGLAFGRTELDTSVTDVFAGHTCGPAGFCGVASSTQWMVGWALGVGFDWAFLPQWTFRTEYLHYDLGSRHQDLTDPAVPGVVIGTSATFRGDIVRGAISFKLN
jgi:outer membrane immunogenic protein